ncbi:hypothetical protein XELAEV_18003483mg [Xenopus laevis]|uniref:Uncharacterized protein n=1 Tax=Xenopus laevis TaxID=8355 RepID=A0A974BNT3_XENLA|nr:hypothetical protein XELAEV_18003483mg [Xenopus laevis]
MSLLALPPSSWSACMYLHGTARYNCGHKTGCYSLEGYMGHYFVSPCVEILKSSWVLNIKFMGIHLMPGVAG